MADKQIVFTEFMKQVDAKIGSMTESEKDAWIREQARTLAAESRADFLRSLDLAAGMTEATGAIGMAGASGATGTSETAGTVGIEGVVSGAPGSVGMEGVVSGTSGSTGKTGVVSGASGSIASGQPPIFTEEEFYTWHQAIMDEEISFQGEAQVEYGESYWDEEDEYEYTDPEGLGTVLEMMLRTAESAMDRGEYETAAEYYRAFFDQSYTAVVDQGNDWIELSLREAIDNYLLSADLQHHLLQALYSEYKASEGSERAEKLFRYFAAPMGADLKVEMLFSAGPEKLPGIETFLEEWSGYLERTKGARAAQLLTEAFLLEGGNDCLIRKAWEALDGDGEMMHPLLVRDAADVLLSEQRFSECEEMGRAAVKRLPKQLRVRAEVADIAALAAERQGHTETADEFRSEAFCSDPALLRYLDFFAGNDWKRWGDKGIRDLEGIPDRENGGNHSDMADRENAERMLPPGQKGVFYFFHQDFEKAMELGRADRGSLGWSSSLKGILVPLFLLLLEGEGQMTPAAGKLTEIVRRRLEYRKNEWEEKAEDRFTERFLLWKNRVDFGKLDSESIISWLEEEVADRTEALVGGSRRNSYHKAAELIVALGEVMEAQGRQGAKEQLIRKYQKMHSRKWAFKAEFDTLSR